MAWKAVTVVTKLNWFLQYSYTLHYSNTNLSRHRKGRWQKPICFAFTYCGILLGIWMNGQSRLDWWNIHSATNLRKSACFPQTRDLCLRWLESTVRFSQSCNPLGLLLFKGNCRETHFNFPTSARKQLKPSSCPWHSRTQPREVAFITVASFHLFFSILELRWLWR